MGTWVDTLVVVADKSPLAVAVPLTLQSAALERVTDVVWITRALGAVVPHVAVGVQTTWRRITKVHSVTALERVAVVVDGARAHGLSAPDGALAVDAAHTRNGAGVDAAVLLTGMVVVTCAVVMSDTFQFIASNKRIAVKSGGTFTYCFVADTATNGIGTTWPGCTGVWDI